MYDKLHKELLKSEVVSASVYATVLAFECELPILLILLLIDVEFKGEWSTRYIDKGRRYRLEIGLPNIHEVRGGGAIVFITGWLGLNSECMYYGKGFV